MLSANETPAGMGGPQNVSVEWVMIAAEVQLFCQVLEIPLGLLLYLRGD